MLFTAVLIDGLPRDLATAFRPERMGNYHLDSAEIMPDTPQRQAGAEVTPEMVVAARAVFDEWMDETDYLEDGFPGDSSVDSAIFSMLASTRAIKPVSFKNRTNLRDISLRLLAASRSSLSV